MIPATIKLQNVGNEKLDSSTSMFAYKVSPTALVYQSSALPTQVVLPARQSSNKSVADRPATRTPDNKFMFRAQRREANATLTGSASSDITEQRLNNYSHVLAAVGAAPMSNCQRPGSDVFRNPAPFCRRRVRDRDMNSSKVIYWSP